MSDDEADESLLELLRQSLGISNQSSSLPPTTGVLRDAEFIYSNAIDVAIDRNGTVSAAATIWDEMQRRSYSTSAWSEHELHPKARNDATLDFIFTMDLLNFSFWSELDETQRYAVEYRGKRWTGYWSLVACLQRALEEGIPITSPSYWWRPEESHIKSDAEPTESMPDIQETPAEQIEPVETQTAATEDDSMTASQPAATLDESAMQHIFRGTASDPMPLLDKRLRVLREASQVLHRSFSGSVATLVASGTGSAARLVNTLASEFDCFRDESIFDGRKVRFLKRAQIFVADVWAAFDCDGHGKFDDIDSLTMFADYRVPQQLHSLGILSFSPSLDHAIRKNTLMLPGSSWECQLRGCSIWAVEMIRRQICAEHPDAKVNAVLLDFFLYDLAKERERDGGEAIPHHRVRSIWY